MSLNRNVTLSSNSERALSSPGPTCPLFPWTSVGKGWYLLNSLSMLTSTHFLFLLASAGGNWGLGKEKSGISFDLGCCYLSFSGASSPCFCLSVSSFLETLPTLHNVPRYCRSSRWPFTPPLHCLPMATPSARPPCLASAWCHFTHPYRQFLCLLHWKEQATVPLLPPACRARAGYEALWAEGLPESPPEMHLESVIRIHLPLLPLGLRLSQVQDNGSVLLLSQLGTWTAALISCFVKWI